MYFLCKYTLTGVIYSRVCPSLSMISKCLVDLTGCLQLNPTCYDVEGHNIGWKLTALWHTTIHFNGNCSIFAKPGVSTVWFIALAGMKWIYFATSTDKTSQTLPLFQTNSSLVYCADKQYSVLPRLSSHTDVPYNPHSALFTKAGNTHVITKQTLSKTNTTQ